MIYSVLSQSRTESLFVSRQRAVNLSTIPVTVTSTGNSRLTAFCIGDNMKKCNKCGETKPLDEFGSHKRYKDGVYSICKSCARLACREYRAANLEKERARNDEYRLKNMDAACKKAKLYRQRHPERALSSIKKWFLAHPGKTAQYKATRRAYLNKVSGKITAQEWQDLKKFYNHTCLKCGRKEPEIKLTLDHVMPVSKGGSNTIQNAQPLCLSCNSGKKDRYADYR